jgi:hypothetical protein
MAEISFLRRGTLTRGQALLYGTLTVGVLDILDAFVFFWFRDLPPVRILHAIASGLLGRAAFEGGAATAALGLLLHFCIAGSIVTIYHLASRRLPQLAESPWIYGPLYGLAAYFVMNLIVLPLSATAGGGTPTAAALANGMLIHVLGVGMPSALFARAAARPEERHPSSALSPA